MLARDTVKRRLESGISYTEFSYVLLQSMDYLNLFREHGVTLQFGGSDQWGNITGGRRARSGGSTGEHAHALRHAADHQGRRHQVRQDRGRRPVARPRDAVALRLPPVLAQRRGREGRASCCASSPSSPARRSRTSSSRRPRSRSCVPARSAWPTRSPRSCTAPTRSSRPRPRPPRCSAGETWPRIKPDTLAAALREAGGTTLPAGELPGILDLLVAAGLAKSKGEARRTVAEGGAYLNNVRVEDPDLQPTDVRPGRRVLARAAPRQEELRRRRGAPEDVVGRALRPARHPLPTAP